MEALITAVLSFLGGDLLQGLLAKLPIPLLGNRHREVRKRAKSVAKRAPQVVAILKKYRGLIKGEEDRQVVDRFIWESGEDETE